MLTIRPTLAPITALMLAGAPLPRGSGATLASAGTLSEGFRRVVTFPPYLVGYVRWDERSDPFLLVRQSFFFRSFQVALRSALYAGNV
jgi:hypothetical protein